MPRITVAPWVPGLVQVVPITPRGLLTFALLFALRGGT